MLGKKESGEAVAKDMRKARDLKNERLFSIEEFLTPQQIKSYLSRFAPNEGSSVNRKLTQFY